MQISEQYFNSEVLKFREMMGIKKNYDNCCEVMDLALKGLAFVYIRATATGIHDDTTPEAIERMLSTFEATSNEYHQRSLALLMMPLKKLISSMTAK